VKAIIPSEGEGEDGGEEGGGRQDGRRETGDGRREMRDERWDEGGVRSHELEYCSHFVQYPNTPKTIQQYNIHYTRLEVPKTHMNDLFYKYFDAMSVVAHY
jgi:hypothetical protein